MAEPTAAAFSPSRRRRMSGASNRSHVASPDRHSNAVAGALQLTLIETETETHAPHTAIVEAIAAIRGPAFESAGRAVLALFSRVIATPVSEVPVEGLISSVVASMGRDIGVASCQRVGCELLSKIAPSASWSASVSTATMTRAAVAAIGAHPNDGAVIRDGCALISAVTSRNRFWSFGQPGVSCIAAALTRHWGTLDVMREAFLALGCIARSDANSRGDIEAAGTVQAALRAIEQFPGDPVLTSSCFLAMRWLRSLDFVAPMLHVVLSLMERHGQVEAVQESGLRLVNSLLGSTARDWAFSSPPSRVASAAVAALAFHKNSSAICSAGHIALRFVAAADQSAALRSGGIAACIATMKPDLRGTFGALWEMVLNNPVAQEGLMEDHANAVATAAFEACKNGSPAEDTSCGLLWTLTSTDALLPRIAPFLAGLDGISIPQQLLSTCINRKQRSTIVGATDRGECSLSVAPLCPTPPECPGTRGFFCQICSRPQVLRRCFTCDGQNGVHTTYCAACVRKFHSGHELSEPFFVPRSCCQVQPPSSVCKE